MAKKTRKIKKTEFLGFTKRTGKHFPIFSFFYIEIMSEKAISISPIEPDAKIPILLVPFFSF